MGPKKITRHCYPCYGPPTIFPDTGSLLTLRDVMTAVDFEKLQQPNVFNSKIHEIVEKKIRKKFYQANPRLPLITESSACSKSRRSFESADRLDKKRLKA